MEKGFNLEKKTESHYFGRISRFFYGSPDFPLSGVGRSAISIDSVAKLFELNLFLENLSSRWSNQVGKIVYTNG